MPAPPPTSTCGPRPQLPLLLKLRDVAAGMRHLHELSICHGDLKADNVLLASSSSRVRDDDTGTVAKIADFGLSRVLLPGQSHLSTRCGPGAGVCESCTYRCTRCGLLQYKLNIVH